MDFGRKGGNLFCEKFKMVRSPKINSLQFFVFFKGKTSIDKICFTKVFLFFSVYINLFYIYGHLIVLEKKYFFLRKYNPRNHEQYSEPRKQILEKYILAKCLNNQSINKYLVKYLKKSMPLFG